MKRPNFVCVWLNVYCYLHIKLISKRIMHRQYFCNHMYVAKSDMSEL